MNEFKPGFTKEANTPFDYVGKITNFLEAPLAHSGAMNRAIGTGLHGAGIGAVAGGGLGAVDALTSKDPNASVMHGAMQGAMSGGMLGGMAGMAHGAFKGNPAEVAAPKVPTPPKGPYVYDPLHTTFEQSGLAAGKKNKKIYYKARSEWKATKASGEKADPSATAKAGPDVTTKVDQSASIKSQARNKQIWDSIPRDVQKELGRAALANKSAREIQQILVAGTPIRASEDIDAIVAHLDRYRPSIKSSSVKLNKFLKEGNMSFQDDVNTRTTEKLAHMTKQAGIADDLGYAANNLMGNYESGNPAGTDPGVLDFLRSQVSSVGSDLGYAANNLMGNYESGNPRGTDPGVLDFLSSQASPVGNDLGYALRNLMGKYPKEKFQEILPKGMDPIALARQLITPEPIVQTSGISGKAPYKGPSIGQGRSNVQFKAPETPGFLEGNITPW